MRVPTSLQPLIDQGVVDEVVRPLMSGKEAQVFVVRKRGVDLIAKLYKESDERSFKHRSQYTEGRKVRNSRDQRAMARGSRYGREQVEQAWRSAEVDTLHRLQAAGVRVPAPHEFVDGVLVMEMVVDDAGRPAPRLTDVELTAAEARALFNRLIAEIGRMLCAGVVHGDLSDFNILIGAEGPVIIDFPQAVDASSNPNARKLLLRDVDNVVSFLSRAAPELKGRAFGQQMWERWSRGELDPTEELDGRWKPTKGPAPKKTGAPSLMEELDAIAAKKRELREKLGIEARPARTPKFAVEGPPEPRDPTETRGKKKARQPAGPVAPAPKAPPTQKPPAAARPGPAPKPAARSKPRPAPSADELVFDDLDALLDVGKR